MEDTTKLNKSKLGTKQYWDDFYNKEKENFNENPDDTGECWFNDSDAEEKMIDFLMNNLNDTTSSVLINEKSTMIDLGTGNGHLLFQLWEEGFKQNKMLGVDYSEQSVLFSKDILEEVYKDAKDTIDFKHADIFNDSWNPGQFDIVLDKGTLDAIALSGLTFSNNQTVVDVYPNVIEKILKPNGCFLITSCNFTEQELIKTIEKSGHLKLWKTIKYPVFEFGGIKGSTICTCAFTTV
ncbi:hypothetical protein ACO0RG_004233 [Hanseniaspora osmophila]|uniref:Protein-lysine N-methyltransferase EFM4 n=1 Tax=Hanseniaspora osmophila TaxID=56408 RepID=A0A1E5RB11_9ASCO|nr:Protein-lysine N-methyltransferase EFM4 [Hanseniaspora osmophila]